MDELTSLKREAESINNEIMRIEAQNSARAQQMEEIKTEMAKFGATPETIGDMIERMTQDINSTLTQLRATMQATRDKLNGLPTKQDVPTDDVDDIFNLF